MTDPTPQPSLAESLLRARQIAEFRSETYEVLTAATAEIERLKQAMDDASVKYQHVICERDAARAEVKQNRSAAESAMRQMSDACSKLGRAEGEAQGWKMRAEHAEQALAHAKAEVGRE